MRTRSLSVVAAAAMLPGLALADAVVVHDAELGERFDLKREIVEIAEAAYGPTPLFDPGRQIPESVERCLVAGRPLPSGAEIGPVPPELGGRLPNSEEGTRWVSVGEHLIEVRPSGTIAMAVCSVLPGTE